MRDAPVAFRGIDKLGRRQYSGVIPFLRERYEHDRDSGESQPID